MIFLEVLLLLLVVAIVWSWCAVILTLKLTDRVRRLDEKLAEHLSLDRRYDRS